MKRKKVINWHGNDIFGFLHPFLRELNEKFDEILGDGIYSKPCRQEYFPCLGEKEVVTLFQ